ncbi:sugar-binding transcriptional regulator [Metallumcola ferriviriculae]|uniref:Sugar-binding transcriptional regulator n=1 Tax=Metallumcola ferriviriculae TaxID=3039180 RepID=A0AAU0UR28_9FIRM|nr:sugar-binding transcriptional regulator [Desulfitibacteraceae bacterium MK1]
MDIHQLVRIARFYYEMGYNQQRIADMEGVSRAKISRLLDKALKEGIVQIKIAYPVESVTELEQALREKFGLKKAFVAPVIVDEEKALKRDVGKAVAQYLGEVVEDGHTVGVSWGTTLPYVSQQLQEKLLKEVKVVQLNGGLTSTYISTGSITIVEECAKAFNGKPYLMAVPTIVDTNKVADALISDTGIEAALDLVKQAEIGVVGIGFASKDSVLAKAGYFTEDQYQELIDKGAVGDICSRYFDIDGNIVDNQLNNRTIGIALSDLASKEHSIGVAVGEHKAPSIIGALSGGYINCLFTDENAARKILAAAD